MFTLCPLQLDKCRNRSETQQQQSLFSDPPSHWNRNGRLIWDQHSSSPSHTANSRPAFIAGLWLMNLNHNTAATTAWPHSKPWNIMKYVLFVTMSIIFPHEAQLLTFLFWSVVCDLTPGGTFTCEQTGKLWTSLQTSYLNMSSCVSSQVCGSQSR